MQRVILWICLVFLCGCANIVNTHPRNAVPLEAGNRLINIGSASASNVYKLHNYTPAVADSTVKNRDQRQFYMQMPLDAAIGLGRGYAIGGQIATFYCPRFKSSIHYGLFSDLPSIAPTISLGFYGKVNLQKSIEIGQDMYMAVFPAYGKGLGVERFAKYTKLSIKYSSIELPLTVSKQIKFSNGKQVILSGTGRVAYDWIDSDLHIIRPEFMHYEFDYYYNQPRLEAVRTAIIGHLDFNPEYKAFFRFQLGMEHIKLKSGECWEPIVYLGTSVILK